jgi:hypothetical protein
VAPSGGGNCETSEDSKEIDYYAFLKVTNLLTQTLVLSPSWVPLQTLFQADPFLADVVLAPADFQADDAKRWQ